MQLTAVRTSEDKSAEEVLKAGATGGQFSYKLWIQLQQLLQTNRKPAKLQGFL